MAKVTVLAMAPPRSEALESSRPSTVTTTDAPAAITSFRDRGYNPSSSLLPVPFERHFSGEPDLSDQDPLVIWPVEELHPGHVGGV